MKELRIFEKKVGNDWVATPIKELKVGDLFKITNDEKNIPKDEIFECTKEWYLNADGDNTIEADNYKEGIN
jgi:hypothetical protein